MKKYIYVALVVLLMTSLITPQLAYAQEGTIYIYDDANGTDCTLIGNWDNDTKTCQMTTDWHGGMVIGDGITLDGDSHSLIGGIALYGVDITIRDIHVEGSGWCVESPYESHNLTIRDSTFEHCTVGPRGNNIRIEGNHISSSGGRGIELQAKNSLIIRNVLAYNSWCGIALFNESDNNVISENDILTNNDSSCGISLQMSDGNTIEKNNISGPNNIGIWMDFFSGNNTIKDNFISGSTWGLGIARQSTSNIFNGNTVQESGTIFYFDDSTGNIFYNNNFINNVHLGWLTDGNTFHLDKPIGGNYWSSFDDRFEGCFDLNLDGLCDAPYIFPGGQDNLPWTRPDRSINQLPVADAGGPYTGFAGDSITLDASVSSDPDSEALTYEWDLDNDGEFDDATGVTTTTAFNQAGEYIVGLRVTDTLGLTNADTAMVSVAEPAPIPTIEALGTNQLAGSGWPLGSAVTMTIDDPTNGVGVDYTVTQMPFEEPWQPEGSLRVPIPVAYFLKPGYIVQATNGEITKTLVYTHLEVTQVDIATETVYGVSDPDANIYVRIHDGDVHLDVTADNNGDWVADFQGVYNLTPTTRGQVRQTDPDGDSTVQFFGSPVMNVYLIDDLIQGLNWKLGAYVTFTIDDPQNGPGVDLTETKIVEVAWWNPNETEIGFATFDLGIRPGQQMVMTDGITTITHIVSRLAVTDINSTANTVAGITNPGSVVEVGRMCDESGCAFRRVTANSDGDWLADFSVPGEDSDEQDLFDIRPGTNVKVIQKDDHGNSDGIYWEVPFNQTPTAETGGPYTTDWGATLTLDGSGSTDPDDNITSYEWDLDNDGEYDDASGVTVTTSFNQVGDHVVGLRVTDDGGLSDTDTATVTILPWTLKGFYQPVDMNGVYNLVKGGSTVPLKFEIFAGATELTDVASVRSLTYAQTSCDATAITDEIETTATGGTSLRYADGQFIYNWKTPKNAGKCYRVTMTTIDGSTLMAYFKLK